MNITVGAGNYLLQANNGILIKSLGGGDVVIGQNGGYFILPPDGTVTITGNKVSIDAEKSVNLRGKVNYEIGSPRAAPKVEALRPLLVEDIPQITPVFPHSL